MTTIAEKEQAQRNKFLNYLIDNGVPMEQIHWLKEKGASSAFLYSTFVGRKTYIDRFINHFDIIKDVDKISHVGLIMEILTRNYNVDSDDILRMLSKLHENCDMTYKNLNRLKDLGSIICNIYFGRFMYYTAYGIRWLDYITVKNKYESWYLRNNARNIPFNNAFDNLDYENIVSELYSDNISVSEIIADVAFVKKYSDIRDEKIIPVINMVFGVFDSLICEYEKFNKTVSDKRFVRAVKAEQRMRSYIDSNTNVKPKKYWDEIFHIDLEHDRELVKKYFSDTTYNDYVEYVNKLVNKTFTTKFHTLENFYDKLSDKFENLYNISLFDYVSTTGDVNISNTLDFIVSTNTSSTKLNKLVKPLSRLLRYTKTYISYDDEMKQVHIIKDHELTTDEKQKIFDYMDANKYPRWNVLFSQIAKAYVEGNVEL